MVRLKCRYIVCEIEFGGKKVVIDLAENIIYSAIVNEINLLHGSVGVAASKTSPSLRVKYLNKDTNLIILRCARGLHKMVQSALPFVKKLKKVDMFFNTIHVAGTVRSCVKFIVRYHKTKLLRMLSECTNEEEKKRIKELIVESCKESSKSVGLMQRLGATSSKTLPDEVDTVSKEKRETS